MDYSINYCIISLRFFFTFVHNLCGGQINYNVQAQMSFLLAQQWRCLLACWASEGYDWLAKSSLKFAIPGLYAWLSLHAKLKYAFVFSCFERKHILRKTVPVAPSQGPLYANTFFEANIVQFLAMKGLWTAAQPKQHVVLVHFSRACVSF